MKDELKKQYDFGGWVIKYDHSTVNGYTYQNGCLKDVDHMTVPLIWNHRHDEPDMVLGHVLFEHSDEGVYVYGKLSSGSMKKDVISMLKDKGSVSLSPYINQIKSNGKIITSGVIREVSLVLVRVDQNEFYYPELWGG